MDNKLLNLKFILMVHFAPRMEKTLLLWNLKEKVHTKFSKSYQ